MSLTVKWYMNDSDNILEYQLDHRILGSDAWNSLTISSEHISSYEDSCQVYKLQQLMHDTLYEVRMRSVNNHVKSKYTELKTQKTLQIVSTPENFDIVDFTDMSLSVKWYMNDSDNRLEYLLDHRILGTDEWISLPLSSEHISTNEDDCQVYTLQQLLHDTLYEVRMCSVNNHIKSKYTELKTQKTLQIVSTPENFDIVDFTDMSLSVKWYMNDSDNRLEYLLDHRILGSDEWISLPFLPNTFRLMKMVVRCTHFNSYCMTLFSAPENFDIVDFTDMSLSVKWYMNDSDNRLEYLLDHRILGSDAWNSLTLSSEHISTNEDGCQVYKLQELLHDTFYEVRMCSVNNHVKSKYTEPKTQKTLQLALPDAISRLQEGDRIRYMKLMQSSETEKRYFVRIMIVDISDDRADRFQRAMNQSKSSENETIEINVEKTNAANKTLESNFTETDNENESKLEVTESHGQDETKNEVLKKDTSTEVSETSNLMFNVLKEPESHQEIKHIDFEAITRIDNGRDGTTISSDIEQSSAIDDNTNADAEEFENTDNVSLQTIDSTATTKPGGTTKSTAKNSENAEHVNEYETDKTSSSIENEEDSTSSSLIMPLDLMSRVFHTTSTSNIPTNIFAVCGLWDFAGQRNFMLHIRHF
ncbi:unnamed protein product [Mytilus edulis]|uniref:Fibronectin type-III domain-containing protein n=1 Tax=Mytilus edulis TaxID=6550 RepID=A0A8S3VKH7_MYTED|nr:unnamed protein product [Mytilus edulis]